MRTLLTLLLLSLAVATHAQSFANSMLFRASAYRARPEVPYYEFYSDVGVLNGSGSPASDGETVGTLQDQSGNGRNITQGTDANRPIYTSTGALNGHNPIVFDGDALTKLSVSGLSGFSVSTIFIVVDLVSAVTETKLYSLNSGGSQTIFVPGSSFTMRSTDSATPRIDSTEAPTTSPTIVVCVYDGTNSSIQITDTAPVTGSISSHDPTQMELTGSFPNGLSFYAKVAYASRWNQTQITNEIARLKTRYGL